MGRFDSQRWLERRVARLRKGFADLDPLILVIGGVSVLVYALHGLSGKLTRDLAVYSYAGQQFADGVPPYEGVLNRAGPLAHMIPGVGAFGARLVGLEDLTGMRILFLLITVACVCVVYRFARELFGSVLPAVCAAFAFLTFGGFIEYASGGPREKTPMALFLLCSLWAAYRGRWVGSGAWLSLATLTLQIAFPVGIAAIVVQAVASRHGERIRALVRAAVGGLAVLATFVIYFAVVGALDDFVQGFVALNAQHTTASLFADKAAANWNNLEAGYRGSLWVAVVGTVGIIALSVPALSARYRARHTNAVAVAALGAATIVALAWTMRDYDSWPDALLVLPMAALGVGAVAAQIIDRLPTVVVRPAVLAWLLAATVMATSFAVDKQDNRLTAQRASVNAKLRLLPSATILSVNAPQALVLTGQTNPIQHQMFFTGLNEYVDRTWPGGLSGLADWISADRPTLITVGGGRVPDWLAPTLKRDYAKVGSAPGWVWYVDRLVGHRTVKRLRHDDRRRR